MSADLDVLLATPVYSGGAERPFGELTTMRWPTAPPSYGRAGGLGHRSRVSGVAAAWNGLAAAMREAGAATVADLDRETLAERADALWVVPPGGSLLPLSYRCSEWTERMLPAGSLEPGDRRARRRGRCPSRPGRSPS